MRVLLVEDEQYLAEAVQHLLRRDGFRVDIARDGQAGLRLAKAGVYDALILDNMLPKLSGIDVLRSLRRSGSAVPILMLSAKSETSHKVEGLEVGADDYLAKPFKTSELIARIHAIIRRHEHGIDEKRSFDDICLVPATRTVTHGQRSVDLTDKEYELLDMLVRQPGIFIPTETLFRRVWGADVFFEPRYVAVYISHLRTKLTMIGSGLLIKSSRGVGYCCVSGAHDNVS